MFCGHASERYIHPSYFCINRKINVKENYKEKTLFIFCFKIILLIKYLNVNKYFKQYNSNKIYFILFYLFL